MFQCVTIVFENLAMNNEVRGSPLSLCPSCLSSCLFDFFINPGGRGAISDCYCFERGVLVKSAEENCVEVT